MNSVYKIYIDPTLGTMNIGSQKWDLPLTTLEYKNDNFFDNKDRI